MRATAKRGTARAKRATAKKRATARAEPSGREQLVVAVLLAAAAIFVVSRQPSGQWESWSHDGFWKLDRGLADPSALYADNEFHVYATSSVECVPGNCPGYSVPHFTSAKLDETGQLRGDAMPDLPAWVDPEDRAIWAPSVQGIGASYVLYFSATSAAAGVKCLGVALSPTPGGPFAPQPEPLHCTARLWSLDPYAVNDGPGGWFLLWRQDTAETPGGSIVAAPLSPDGLAIAGGGITLLVGAFPWEDTPEEPGIGPVENPAMARHPATGEWLLTWSANNWQTVNYATGVAVCAGPLGPCTRLGQDTPWLRTSEDPSITTSATFAGAGGLGFVTDPDGRLYAVFHAYRGLDNPVDRARVGWAFAVEHGDSGYHLSEF